MNPSEEFRLKLESGNISEALSFLVSKIVEFKITTWIATEEDNAKRTRVSNQETSFETTDNNTKAKVAPDSCLRTTFNLLEGIEHQLGKSILTSESYLEVREYHLSQVDRIDQMVNNNLETLKKIVEILEKSKDWQAIEIPTEAINIPNREITSSFDTETDFKTNSNGNQTTIISKINKNSVIFIADDNVPGNGNSDRPENIDLPPHTRGKLKQEDWGDWLDVNGEETAMKSNSNNGENKDLE
jgi:hypothetical protein